MKKDKFNEQLNASGQPDRQFRQWYDYRKKVTDFVLANMGDINSMIVIGAGNCNDIDLRRLEGNNRKVILTDIDLKAMKQGCQRQGVEAECIPFDYLGLEESSLIEEVKQQMLMFNHERFNKSLRDIVQRSEGKGWQWSPVPNRLIVILPIYTQLLFRQLENILKDAWATDLIDEEEFLGAVRELLDCMPKIINAFNQRLLSISHEATGLIVFSDYIEDRTDGEYSRLFNPDSFEENYNNYCQRYGMGLGHYGVYALSQSMKVMKEQWYLWPFDENRHMFVKGLKMMHH